MKPMKFFEASYWRKLYPGKRALILIAPTGGSFLLKEKDPLPKGKFRLLSYID